MAAPLEDTVEFFLEQVRENTTLTEAEKREFYEKVIRCLTSGVEGTHRWGKSMTIGKYGQEAGQRRKKRS